MAKKKHEPDKYCVICLGSGVVCSPDGIKKPCRCTQGD